MHLAIFALALAANSYELPPAQRIATATVIILPAEEIHFGHPAPRDDRGRLRQQRVRDGVPLVEFY
jgi:hypothetical protein